MAAIVSLINNNSNPIMAQSQTDSKSCNSPNELHHIKQTLKTLIQSRRVAKGNDTINTDFDTRKSDDDPKLTPHELIRQKNRRDQNRRASKKCRQKKRRQVNNLLEEEKELLLRRCQLEAKFRKLNSEKEKLLHAMQSKQLNCL